ncbi:uncharacterized protein LOC120926570 isoform X2 [Rana temporaria]|uniref:uncharacterized protein LOC120926570 isoform X2 n=1 Tax=Rana temporaria TaxID=8407 RepID=UPI001AAC94BE|nr:uncharacterized protein LOC120926570 isoform X2 [Rana temporaria]
MDYGLCKGLLEGLSQTEKTFQETMRRIYEKYDHAFEEDIVVNIVDFTYNAPDGRVQWDFEPKTTREGKREKEKTPEREQYSTFIQSVMEEVSENNDSDPTWRQHCKPKYATGNLSPSIKLSAGNKETCLPKGNTQTLMPYTGSNIGNKTFYVSPLHCSVPMQIKSFVRRHNKDCSFEDTREFSYIDYQADESRLQHCRETAYCDSGDSNLAHYYPDMVECIRRLWEMPWKKRAADNIVQYYKRHVWNAKKLSTQQRYCRPFNSRRMHFHSLREYETIKGCFGYKNTVSQSKHFKKSDFMESVHSPGNKTFTINSNKDSGSIILDHCFTKQNKVDTQEIGFCMKEQNSITVSNCSPVRRNMCSRFPFIQSPMKACSIDGTIILDKTFTYQNTIETDDANSSIYRNDISKLSEATDVLSESLFSAFPVLQSPRKNIVTLGSSMESKATTPCKSFIKQNQVERYKADSFYNKEQNKHAFMYRKRPATHDVNSSFQNNIKQISQVAGTPPRASPGKHNVMLKCGTDLNNTSLDNTFTYQNAVEFKPYFKEQDKHHFQTSAPFRKKSFSFSALPLLHSPNNTKSFSGLNNTVVNLNKTVNYQEGLKTEVAACHNQELTRPFWKLDNPLRRRNSFSNLPVADNLREKKISNLMFEDIYKMENLNGSHPNIPVQSSEMVLSLVNSPGSRRSKRRANGNLFFSTFKRQKSADETFIKSINNTDSLPKPSPKFSAWS